MAVPFFVPEGEDQRENGPSSQPQSTTSSATQTPLQSPINDEHLIQAFYEALSLYSADLLQGTPASASPPSSPSCCYSHFNYRGDVFFPQTSSSSSPRTPIRFERSQNWRTTRQELRRRLNSNGDDSSNYAEENNDCPLVNGSRVPADYNLNDHFNYLAARENLQEFSGRVPQKKKKAVEEKTQSDSRKTKTKEQNFVWPVVTAVVIAVGCGFLVTR